MLKMLSVLGSFYVHMLSLWRSVSAEVFLHSKTEVF